MKWNRKVYWNKYGHKYKYRYSVWGQNQINRYLYLLINMSYCRGWLIKQRMDEFVMEKYIETSISTRIVYEMKIK